MNDLKTAEVKRALCFGCWLQAGVLATVEDGKVVKLKGEPGHPVNQSWICERSKAFIEHLYHEDRLNYPLKRIGERGAGNPAESFACIFPQHTRAKRKGTKYIVIDPKFSESAGRLADHHLMLRPGTDAALALGWLNVIIEEKLYDQDFVEKWCHGFDQLKERVKQYPPERVAEITRLSRARGVGRHPRRKTVSNQEFNMRRLQPAGGLPQYQKDL